MSRLTLWAHSKYGTAVASGQTRRGKAASRAITTKDEDTKSNGLCTALPLYSTSRSVTLPPLQPVVAPNNRNGPKPAAANLLVYKLAPKCRTNTCKPQASTPSTPKLRIEPTTFGLCIMSRLKLWAHSKYGAAVASGQTRRGKAASRAITAKDEDTKSNGLCTALPLYSTSRSVTGEEQCAFQPKDSAPVSRFDNYKWRGPHLHRLTFFEYCMLVQSRRRYDATASDIEFHERHPKSHTHIQHIARTKSQVMTVSFHGQLSQYQSEEETIPRGHPTTAAIKNDLAELLLGFFIPWEHLPTLFQQHASQYDTKHDACSKIWAIVEPTLSPHNRNFAENMELLRKSREDGRVDAALHATEPDPQESLEYDIDNMESTNFDSDTEDELSSITMQHEFTSEALITA